MVLVDTSIWIDHLHQSDLRLIAILERGEAAQHPMVLGELSLGNLRGRESVLALLGNLASTEVATHAEVAHFIEAHELHGRGLSLVDVHLLASVVLTAGARLWTRDKRLLDAAERLGVAH